MFSLAGLALAAFTAASVPTHAVPGISIYPAAVTAPSGASQASFTIIDSGTTNLTVKLGTGQLKRIAGTAHSWAVEGSYAGATISPSSLALKPGERRTITVKVTANDAYRHDIAVEAESVTPAIQSGANVSTQVVARYTVNANGQPAKAQSTPIAQAAPITLGGNDDVVIIPALGGLALLTLFGGGLIYSRRRHRGTRRGAHSKHTQPLIAPWRER